MGGYGSWAIGYWTRRWNLSETILGETQNFTAGKYYELSNTTNYQILGSFGKEVCLE
jgi:hypothetical protein